MLLFSPEQLLSHPLYQQKSVQVYMKRDDMIHPFISGNKWRKLKYNLLKASELGRDTLITFGGAWSNHILAVACAAASGGFQSRAFIRGEEISNPVLDMCRLFGMELLFVSREAYKDKDKLFSQLEETDRSFMIDEGGAGMDGARGCSEIISELEQQYDHIFVAAGTGTTAAGVAMGIAQQDRMNLLHVVPVLKGGAFIADEMQQLGADLQQCRLHLDYHFGGYAKVKPELIQFVQGFVQQTGIMIEPTYTGKALFALHDLLEKDMFEKGSRILFIHTGGLTGLLGQLKHFQD
ncbi:1-aminocyclopropane-1-carboxylate deaminase/D-cysteine desulfhydrase [Sphingobacterium yanglingense]|uniref:1-aminocyclopropane-1-carboxylate deaminase n=1 Tax=Sphingobacterium yanglingense TaxID=1437280 RepID=A0A4R6WMR3_9SPHI|nr:pyridoxal-phosphate dependent enzyme [Sphingobacterium yanglingense]TDQ79645.1 1-aminocyclopropane-1-carboxylate deaminase [Sphingobacterium yanglingense]